MDLQDQRMQCLKMAFELGGNPDAVLSAAQRMMDFIAGRGAEVANPLADALPATVAADGATAEVPPAEPVDADHSGGSEDAIAACGTALVMPEGGTLEDAVAAVEPTADVAPPEPVAEALADAASDGVVERVTDGDASAPADGEGEHDTALLASEGSESVPMEEPAVEAAVTSGAGEETVTAEAAAEASEESTSEAPESQASDVELPDAGADAPADASGAAAAETLTVSEAAPAASGEAHPPA